MGRPGPHCGPPPPPWEPRCPGLPVSLQPPRPRLKSLSYSLKDGGLGPEPAPRPPCPVPCPSLDTGPGAQPGPASGAPPPGAWGPCPGGGLPWHPHFLCLPRQGLGVTAQALPSGCGGGALGRAGRQPEAGGRRRREAPMGSLGSCSVGFLGSRHCPCDRGPATWGHVGPFWAPLPISIRLTLWPGPAVAAACPAASTPLSSCPSLFLAWLCCGPTSPCQGTAWVRSEGVPWLRADELTAGWRQGHSPGTGCGEPGVWLAAECPRWSPGSPGRAQGLQCGRPGGAPGSRRGHVQGFPSR